MPPRGKCWSCGEIAFLTAKVLKNKETGSLHCVMICEKCKKFYESGEIDGVRRTVDERTDDNGV